MPIYIEEGEEFQIGNLIMKWGFSNESQINLNVVRTAISTFSVSMTNDPIKIPHRNTQN